MLSKLLSWVRGSKKSKEWGINIKISMKQRSSNRFKTLMERKGITNPEDVVREALRVYEYLVLEHELGTKFYKKENGQFVLHPFFE